MNKVAQLNPKNARAYYIRGVCQQKLKKYKDAQVDYSRAI